MPIGHSDNVSSAFAFFFPCDGRCHTVSMRLLVVAVPPDGNCLFAALARGLRECGSGYDRLQHSDLRAMAAQWIRDTVTWDETRRIQTGSRHKDEYVASVARTGVWGSALELEAVANALCVKVMVYFPGQRRHTTYRPSRGRSSRACVRILFSGNHFDALVLDP